MTQTNKEKYQIWDRSEEKEAGMGLSEYLDKYYPAPQDNAREEWEKELFPNSPSGEETTIRLSKRRIRTLLSNQLKKNKEDIRKWIFDNHDHHDEEGICEDKDFPYVNSMDLEKFLKKLR